jgi:tetratricopeptide (TPR) repeat protein
MINILCDQALLNGYASDTKKIGPELIKEGTENTLIPLNTKKGPAAEAQKQKTAKQPAATAPTTENTTEPSRIATAKTDIRTPGRKTAYWVPIALTAVLGLAAYFYLNAGFRVSSRGSQMDPGQAQSSVKPAEPAPGAGEIGRLQGQMLELRKQKDDAETHLRELQTRFGALEKDQQELKAAKALVAEFETAIGLKDKDLLATYQKFKEAEKELAQEKSAKDRLVSELSSKEAVIAELQKKLESSGGEVDTFKKENTRLQAELVEVNNQRGAAETQGNKPEEAARAYGNGLLIAKKLAEGDPSNPQRQRDFLVSYNNLGDVAVAQGKLEEAARAYGEGLGIAKKHAAGDPSNPLLQRDLWVSYWRLADMAERQQKAGEAKGYWKQAFDVLSGIEKQGLQLSPQDRQYLEAIRRKAGAAP